MTADLSSPGRCLFSQLRSCLQMDAMTPDGHLCSGPCREAWDGAPSSHRPRLDRTFFFFERKKKKPAQSGSSLLRRKEKQRARCCERFWTAVFPPRGSEADRWRPLWGVSADLQQSTVYSKFHSFLDSASRFVTPMRTWRNHHRRPHG